MTKHKDKRFRPIWAEKADLELRRRRITQTELAEKIGISRPTVSLAINSGRCGEVTKTAICSYLGLSV